MCVHGDVSRAVLQFPAALSESRAPTLLTFYTKPSETARPQVKSFGEISRTKRIFLSLEGWLVVTSAGWSLLIPPWIIKAVQTQNIKICTAKHMLQIHDIHFVSEDLQKALLIILPIKI